MLEGVYNYCNRWCERCRFTARCTVFVNSHPDSPEARDTVPFEPVMNPERAEALDRAGAFREPTPEETKAWERDEELRESRAKSAPASELAEAYVLAAETAFGEMGALDHASLEVLQHYHFFIQAKVYRAMRGLHDEDFDPLDMESDAYGTAKVALVAMDEMMNAWLTLGTNSTATSEIHEAVDLLGRTRAALEQALPRAREFIRPGFDGSDGGVLGSDGEEHAVT